MSVSEVKPCCRCREVKPLEQFPKDRRKKDGRSSRCKECAKVPRTPERHRELMERSVRSSSARLGVGTEICDVAVRDVRRLLSQPCRMCGYRRGIVLDHVIPLVRGGRHSVGNLQPLCHGCNASKGGRLMIEWRVRHWPAYSAFLALLDRK